MLGTSLAFPIRIFPPGISSSGKPGVAFSMFSGQKGQNMPSDRWNVSSIFGIFGGL